MNVENVQLVKSYSSLSEIPTDDLARELTRRKGVVCYDVRPPLVLTLRGPELVIILRERENAEGTA